MSQINFKNKCVAMGRNGTSYQVGLDILPSSRVNEHNQQFEILVLTPINTQCLTNGWVEVEVEAIPELINHLQFFYDNRKLPKE